MKNWMRACAFGLALGGAASCGMIGGGGGQSYRLQPASETPAATGKVKVTGDKNTQNHKVTVNVDHLPVPSELDPALTTYVVWMDPAGDRPLMPMAQIDLNKDRQGEVTVNTTFQQFDMVVSAESTPTPKKPSDFVVLEGSVDTRQL